MGNPLLQGPPPTPLQPSRQSCPKSSKIKSQQGFLKKQTDARIRLGLRDHNKKVLSNWFRKEPFFTQINKQRKISRSWHEQQHKSCRFEIHVLRKKKFLAKRVCNSVNQRQDYSVERHMLLLITLLSCAEIWISSSKFQS